jgi:hypothetical protein
MGAFHPAGPLCASSNMMPPGTSKNNCPRAPSLGAARLREDGACDHRAGRRAPPARTPCVRRSIPAGSTPRPPPRAARRRARCRRPAARRGCPCTGRRTRSPRRRWPCRGAVGPIGPPAVEGCPQDCTHVPTAHRFYFLETTPVAGVNEADAAPPADVAVLAREVALEVGHAHPRPARRRVGLPWVAHEVGLEQPQVAPPSFRRPALYVIRDYLYSNKN